MISLVVTGGLQRSHLGRLLRSGLICLLSSCGSDVTYLPSQNRETETVLARPGIDRAADAGTSPSGFPSRAESAGCLHAAVIEAGDLSRRELIRLSGSTATGADTTQSRLGGCDGATSGPEVWYELDLQAATQAIDVRAILDASFDAALDLRRGPCADTLSLDCDRANALGGPSSALAARLDPGLYWLVVDGKDSASRGDFQLQLALDPGNGACPEPPVNVSCETASPLSVLDVQSVFVDSQCTTVDPATDEQEVLYYSLDLSSEAAPIGLQLSRWDFAVRSGAGIRLSRQPPERSGCGETVAQSYLEGESARAGTEVTTVLEPGRYIVALVSIEPSEAGPGPSVLTLRFDRAACRAGPVGDTCEDAIELETGPGAYLLEGSTLCNTNHVTLTACDDTPSPDQFYRLDLRAEATPTRAQLTILTDGIHISPLMYLLTENGAGGCGDGLYCVDYVSEWEGPPHYELNLEPALYFIGVESSIGGGGSYRLLVELDRSPPSACATTEVAECIVRNYLVQCCFDWEDPECPELIIACGLASETQRCVCEKNAACCGAGGDTSNCADAYAACNYLCPEFAPSSYGCLDPYR